MYVKYILCVFSREEDVDCLALVDELYAKPFENKLYEDPEGLTTLINKIILEYLRKFTCIFVLQGNPMYEISNLHLV